MGMEIVAYADGGGKKANGGWAVAYDAPGVAGLPRVRHGRSYAAHTTPNRMELAAIAHAMLLPFEYPTCTRVGIWSDSEYAVNGLVHSLSGWALDGWKTGLGAQIAHKDLWQAVFNIRHRLNVRSIDYAVTWVARCSTRGAQMADEYTRLPASDTTPFEDGVPMVASTPTEARLWSLNDIISFGQDPSKIVHHL